MAKKLRKEMSIEEFTNGYWYARELHAFAKQLGYTATSKLRKDELEPLIHHYLKTGKKKTAHIRKRKPSQSKDTELGLHPDLPVKNYADTKETKAFIHEQAQKQVSGLKQRSGVLYRLNRWREEQLAKQIPITYADVIASYIELNQSPEKFKQIPSARFNNFISEYLKVETDATRKQAMQAWEELKILEIPKTYQAWKKYQSSRKKTRFSWTR
ncbi:MAG: hypothetical protein AAF518_25730 [Spirochaetota bacterium]